MEENFIQRPVSAGNEDISRALTIPLGEALITALLSGVLALCLCAVFSWPAVYALLVFGVVAWLSWIAFSRYWLSIIERMLGVESAPEESEPEPEPARRIELVSENGRASQFIEFPCSERQALELSRGVERGAGLSEAEWCGNGKAFSKLEYVKLRSYMLTHGLAEWRNERARFQGIKLTQAGYQVLTTHPLGERSS